MSRLGALALKGKRRGRCGSLFAFVGPFVRGGASFLGASGSLGVVLGRRLPVKVGGLGLERQTAGQVWGHAACQGGANDTKCSNPGSGADCKVLLSGAIQDTESGWAVTAEGRKSTSSL